MLAAPLHAPPKGWEMPDVVLVRKHYPKYRKKKHDRTWKLKSIAKDAPDVPGIGVGLAPDTDAGKPAVTSSIYSDPDLTRTLTLQATPL